MSGDLARSVGERVQFYRTASRRTKAVVAGLAGITPDYLYQIERGQKVLLRTAEREAPEDMQYRPAAHVVLRTVAQRGRRHVAAEASQLALRIGLPV